MKLAALISGGKDSIYATYLASKDNEIEVIITIKSENPESYMYHVPNVDLVKLQADAMDLPLIFKHTKGIKEEELKELEDALIEAKDMYNIEGVVSGAVLSKYQKERIDKICDELGLKSITQLWNREPKEILEEMLNEKFEVIISAIAAEGLEQDLLGKKINNKILEKLISKNISPIGEGGEFETFVLDCPLFKKRIEITGFEMVWDIKTSSGELIIKKTKLKDKKQ